MKRGQDRLYFSFLEASFSVCYGMERMELLTVRGEGLHLKQSLNELIQQKLIRL